MTPRVTSSCQSASLDGDERRVLVGTLRRMRVYLTREETQRSDRAFDVGRAFSFDHTDLSIELLVGGF